MISEDDDIPTVEYYRGVAIHDQQPAPRIQNVVRPAIDVVFAENSLDALAAIAQDVSKPPEARALAAAKLEAAFNHAVSEHRERPDIDVEYAKASAAIANSRHWRDPDNYCSLLCVGINRAEPVSREKTL